ncbi:MAG: hypothetical protein LBQ20_10940 [Rhodanobacter sp.]|nr:hypothetical protein [Rhodanobacter sp.]
MGTRLLTLALTLAVFVLTLPAWASNTVPYLDANGASQTAPSATDLTGDETTLTSGWYLASGSLTYASTLTVSGDVHLILADGSNLTVNGSSTKSTFTNGDAGIHVSADNSLTIYAQSTGSGMGRLVATGGGYGAGIGGGGDNGDGGTITINGGMVTASGNPAGLGGAGIGGDTSDYHGGAGGTLTILTAVGSQPPAAAAKAVRASAAVAEPT